MSRCCEELCEYKINEEYDSLYSEYGDAMPLRSDFIEQRKREHKERVEKLKAMEVSQ